MFEHKKIQDLNDFFVELNNRRDNGVYFYRINGYNEQIRDFVQSYYEEARLSGVVIEGRIPNPDEKNLSYYGEIMGMNFQMSTEFIEASLRKWLPRINAYQRETVAASIYGSLESMQKTGKNENMIRNAYIKFMCWLYYRFERIVNQLGGNKIPKILYEGEISKYELILISILSNAGCDAVLLQYNGDAGYLQMDPRSAWSDNLCLPGMTAFPDTFCLKQIQKESAERISRERLYGRKPQVQNCTNAWIKGDIFQDIKTNARNRGSDPGLFYNCFCRINGVEDKLTYMNELYQFQLEMKSSGRRTLILEDTIMPPAVDEISAVKRGVYSRQDQMLMDLSGNIRYAADQELQRLMRKAFVDVLLDEGEQPGINLNKLTSKAVYLICWLKRFQSELFSGWKLPEISLCIYFGGCKNGNEALFMRFLARLPVDVLILVPNLNTSCLLQDKFLYEINHVNSLSADKFPRENAGIHMGTAAYHAEKELDTLLYQSSGLYRDRQYSKANAVTLQTMYEEIAILWNQELKYRPNFSTVNNVVNMPVIFAKVSGVKDGNVAEYWKNIKKILTENTFLIRNVPYISHEDANPIKAYAAEFYKNGRLQKNRIKSHPGYQYGYLREEIQDYLLEKLQALIEQKSIKGTFVNGTEYTIVSTALNMPKDILRWIQRFDFTKKNPKAVYISTTEELISLEDAILMAYLNLIGFDVVFFVPTGYQTVEKHYSGKLLEEYQIGEYIYDLRIPDFDKISLDFHQGWINKIFKRGT